MDFEPLRIEGIDPDNVGEPRADGTAGSALYSVPIRLSRRVTGEESGMLEQLWDRPPSFTTMHRPGIARVVGDSFILDGTTVDEVARYHARTLSLVVDQFSTDMPEVVQARLREAALRQTAADAHREHVRDIAGQVWFD